MYSILRCLQTLSILFQDKELKFQLINRNFLFPCIILQHSSEEGLSEVESGHPEHIRNSILYPFIEHANPLIQVLEIIHQWF